MQDVCWYILSPAIAEKDTNLSIDISAEEPLLVLLNYVDKIMTVLVISLI